MFLHIVLILGVWVVCSSTGHWNSVNVFGCYSVNHLLRRIPEAWSRPPIFLVVKNIARRMRRYPPSQSLDELEMRGALKE